MTSRERVLKTLNHQTPDRVPIDFGGFQTGIHKTAYAALVKHLGLREEIAILDPVQQLARPSEAVLERFHVDTRYVLAHGPDGFDGAIRKVERNGRLWHDLKDEFGLTYVFITHDLATVRAISDKIAVMYKGEVRRYGSKTDVLTPPFDDYTDLLLSSVPEMRLGWLEEVLAHRKMESAGN